MSAQLTPQEYPPVPKAPIVKPRMRDNASCLYCGALHIEHELPAILTACALKLQYVRSIGGK